ncbi:xanthine dehydrogenase family protein molybdopterin-binding subunit [Micromonospora sp. Llam7]|uniref:xanthine dehydrogenase family protein molybdopterin-binding subunit n=1 Tax=Micromonospora tarapacensis TaxID=2835305 RepID=UPI001C82B14A|nr:xanthine dehydrogenase family protein molybdopterin-binding subunit [Micromonospora tarapacensis]MBX7267747.1 xanthine dehydrogenase family protein molybdopterin-binding subunit [Micromonospora tarapacensis]
MTMTEPTTIVGAGIDRVDGPLKVKGAAPYSSDVSYPGMAHLALVRSTVAAGRVSEIDTALAEAVPGVLAIITHRNAARLAAGPMTSLGPTPPPPFQDDRILFHGQYVAAVVAETSYQAAAAARAVIVGYESAEAVVHIDDSRGEVAVNPFGSDGERGDVAAALASADVVHKATYTTAENTNNPLGLFATVAVWNGDEVTVHDATQWTSNTRTTIAQMFGIPESTVRVYAEYVGGAFGSGLRVWPHVILAVLAARTVGRPVKLVLSRPEMFTGVGHRPGTVQTIAIGARRDGKLVAIDHESLQTVAMEDENMEPVAASSANAYACAYVANRDRQRRLNIPCPGSMRAPAEAQANFALESALDELSYQLGIDPLDLRLRNYAEVQPQSGLPWSSKALRECYTLGAERFGWSRRDPRVGSMRDGRWLVGYGMAGVSYLWWQSRCEARATIGRDGTGYVRSAANDIGTGAYTVMWQLSAELLGLPLEHVRFDLGDSDMPWAPQAGGSGLTGALGNAVYASCRELIRVFLNTVTDDAASPLRGCTIDDVAVSGGRIHRKADARVGESYTAILDRHGLDGLTADGASAPPDPREVGLAPAGAFAAKFVEVHVDPDLGLLRIPRVVSVIDGGRILNDKLARSQITGATVGGIGQALLEETVTDGRTGRIANASFSDYLVPVNADIGELDVVFVGEPDRLTPVGTKGVGEVGLPGVAAAIANAVYHATGKRIRSLPVTLDQLLPAGGEPSE